MPPPHPPTHKHIPSLPHTQRRLISVSDLTFSCSLLCLTPSSTTVIFIIIMQANNTLVCMECITDWSKGQAAEQTGIVECQH